MARDRDPNRPAPTSASRDERLRAALRANLARRKAQSRERAADDAAQPGSPNDKDSARMRDAQERPAAPATESED